MNTAIMADKENVGFVAREYDDVPWIDEAEAPDPDFCANNNNTTINNNRSADCGKQFDSYSDSFSSVNLDRLDVLEENLRILRQDNTKNNDSNNNNSRITTSQLILILIRMLIVNMALPFLDVITDVRSSLELYGQRKES